MRKLPPSLWDFVMAATVDQDKYSHALGLLLKVCLLNYEVEACSVEDVRQYERGERKEQGGNRNRYYFQKKL